MTREDLILSLGDKVRILAARKYRAIKIHHVVTDYDDLYQAAWIGAIKAVDKFKPTMSFKLETFAENKIAYSILDELRAMCVLKEWQQKKKMELPIFVSLVES